MNLSLTEIAAAVEGTLIQDSQKTVTGVEFDTRKLTAGNLFVPLKGARDGHEFVQAAIENGAVAAFWSQSKETAPKTIAVILVADPLTALQKLARYYLNKVGAKPIGITGSNGKTTTKDLTASVLSEKFKTYKTQGNYNNDIGLPYTILHMPEDTEAIVLEMGMDHKGEIHQLSTLAQPIAAGITIIGEAHIENLGSRAGIADAKLEITDGLAKDGLLLVPTDEPLLFTRTAQLSQTVKTFGIADGDIAAAIVKEEKTQTTFEIAGECFTIPVPGHYNVKNALIAYGIGQWLGLDIAQIRRGLAKVQLTQNRTQWLKAQNGAEVLSDVYNANPTAMGLVLDTFSQLATNGRRIAVLADMLELGPDSAAMHAKMSRHLSAANFAKVFLFGSEMTALAAALAKEQPQLAVAHYTVSDKEKLITAIVAELRPDDMIVLKGSNGMKLQEVIDALV